MDAWEAIGAIGSIAAAGVAAWAAHQSLGAATKASEAAEAMVGIERSRRHSELTPRLLVTCEVLGPGDYGGKLRLRVKLLGPVELASVDSLTLAILDDHFRRGDEKLIEKTPSAPYIDEIKRQVWGPYRFTPQVGPDDARADATGRETVYGSEIPIGAELPFQLEPTSPPSYSAWSFDQWQRDRGTLLRLALVAAKAGECWRLVCELDTLTTETSSVSVEVP